ncbi:UNVERIFIED_CONTAM: undecaprenyl-diphosphatase [Brevibacillus sp. OAP136]
MDVSSFNITLFRAINDLANGHPALNAVFVFLAEQMAYVLALSMVLYWFTRTKQNRLMVISAVVSFGIAELLGLLAGHFVSHPQPFAALPHVNQLIPHGVDNSFPSDHSLLFFSVCVSYGLVRKKEGWLWLVVACCVAISRVWVGVHYPGDIAAGALIGTVSALAAYRIVPKLSAVAGLLAVYENAEKRFWPVKAKGRTM